MIDVYIDGGVKPNPGFGGLGVVIKNNGVTYTISEKVAEHTTNNYCEYSALICALTRLIEMNFNSKPTTIHSDSSLIILQMTGKQKVANQYAEYVPLYYDAIALKDLFDNLSFKQIPRELNKEADRLASEAVTKWFI